MGAHQDPVQRAVVFILAVISTLLDGAFDALVGMTVHKLASFALVSGIVWQRDRKICWKNFPRLHLEKICDILRRKIKG